MNEDIKKWLNHVNDSSTSRKRKRDDDDLINELTYINIEALTNIIKEQKIKNSKLDDFLTNLSNIFEESTTIFDMNEEIKNNKDFYLVIKASLAILIKLITKIKISKLNKKDFNVIKFLNEYKKDYYVPEHKRTLREIKIAFSDIVINNIDLKSVV